MKKRKVLTAICQTVREDYRGTERMHTAFYGGGDFLRVGFLPQYRRTGYTQYARCDIRRAGRCDINIVLCDINIVLIDQPIEPPPTRNPCPGSRRPSTTCMHLPSVGSALGKAAFRALPGGRDPIPILNPQ